MKYVLPCLLLLLCTCGPAPSTSSKPDNDLTWTPYDQSSKIKQNADNESPKLRYQLIQSRITDRNVMLNAAKNQLGDFSAADYERLKPMIY
jgi:amidase